MSELSELLPTDRYEPVRRLGAGAFGAVYLARDRTLDRPVAIKVLNQISPGAKLWMDALERFRREAKVLAGLDHPAVVPLLDADLGAGPPYLVSAYLPGGDLQRFLRKEQLSREKVAAIGARLARGLEAVHAAGLLHRDVKPANVLLDEHGEPHLTDFGLAFVAEEHQQRLTETGMVVGSLRYMAPEILTLGEYSPASDVYALGVMLLELLAGRPSQTRDFRPGAVQDFARELPADELRSQLMWCVRSDPGDRPELGPLAETLEGFARDTNTRILPPPSSEAVTAEIVRAPEPPEPGGLAPRVGAGLLLLGLAAVWMAQGGTTPPPPSDLPPPVVETPETHPATRAADSLLEELSDLGGVVVNRDHQVVPGGPDSFALLDGDPMVWDRVLERLPSLPALYRLAERTMDGPRPPELTEALERVRVAFHAQDLPDPLAAVRTPRSTATPGPAVTAWLRNDLQEDHGPVPFPREPGGWLGEALLRMESLRVRRVGWTEGLRGKGKPLPAEMERAKLRFGLGSSNLGTIMLGAFQERPSRIALWRWLRPLEEDLEGVLRALGRALEGDRETRMLAALGAQIHFRLILRPLFWGRLLHASPDRLLGPGPRSEARAFVETAIRNAQVRAMAPLHGSAGGGRARIVNAFARRLDEHPAPAPEDQLDTVMWIRERALMLDPLIRDQSWDILGKLIRQTLALPDNRLTRAYRRQAVFDAAIAVERGGAKLGLGRGEVEQIVAELRAAPALVARKFAGRRPLDADAPRAPNPEEFLAIVARGYADGR